MIAVPAPGAAYRLTLAALALALLLTNLAGRAGVQVVNGAVVARMLALHTHGVPLERVYVHAHNEPAPFVHTHCHDAPPTAAAPTDAGEVLAAASLAGALLCAPPPAAAGPPATTVPAPAPSIAAPAGITFAPVTPPPQG